jgi:hypothetical protein
MGHLWVHRELLLVLGTGGSGGLVKGQEGKQLATLSGMIQHLVLWGLAFATGVTRGML